MEDIFDDDEDDLVCSSKAAILLYSHQQDFDPSADTCSTSHLGGKRANKNCNAGHLHAGRH